MEIKLIAIMEHYWAKGDTIPEALKKLKEISGRTARYYQIWLVDEKSYCDQVSGGIIWFSFTPRLILEKLPKKKVKHATTKR